MERVKTLSVPDREGWRDWLSQNHKSEREVWLVLYKKGAGRRGASYDEAVEEALCFGWIDSIIRKIDGESYAQRFTPRKPGSNWSASNLARINKLIRENRMTASGLAAIGVKETEEGPMRVFEMEGLLGRRKHTAKPYLEFLRVASFSSGVYVLQAGETDLQTPHSEDELYYVLEGRAMIRVADQERKVGPGTLVFVPSRVSHRFHDIETDLAVLVFFAPAET
ncbi:MAG: cupin domain-containing protein [Thaumarchaeota archaeon]|nr:cupin domain-containing protein [Nitrososphaerota archaeon]